MEQQIRDIIIRGKSGLMAEEDLPTVRFYLGCQEGRVDKEGNPQSVPQPEFAHRLWADTRTYQWWENGEVAKGIPLDIQLMVVSILEGKPVPEILRPRIERRMRDKKPWQIKKPLLREAVS